MMTVALVVVASLVAASAQVLLTPYCPDRSAPREVDSPCNDGCRFTCNQNLCQITRVSMTATNVNCSNEAFRPFCGGDTPNPSTDLLCTSGCKYYCRGSAQNSLCTMTPVSKQWSLICTPLPTKTEQATDCSNSMACVSAVGQCNQFTRRCTCFLDNTFQEAGCFRIPIGYKPASPPPSPPPTTTVPTTTVPTTTPSSTSPNCEVSSWSAWTCSTLCGSGTETRTRNITLPATSGGSCPEASNLSESRSCSVSACCPVDCTFNMWSAWSACAAATCTRSRSRSIRTAASCGGTTCANSTTVESGVCGADDDCALSRSSSKAPSSSSSATDLQIGDASTTADQQSGFSNNTGAIATIGVAVVGLPLIVATAVFLWRRYHRQREQRTMPRETASTAPATHTSDGGVYGALPPSESQYASTGIVSNTNNSQYANTSVVASSSDHYAELNPNEIAA